MPALSVVIPTFNNVKVLATCLEAWQTVARGQPVEILVIEDGCTDSTPDYLRALAATPWGQRHLSWHHQDDLHELRCTNHGFREAKAPLLLAWQDDMFLRSPWLVPELLTTFATYADLGLLCLSRGLNCTGVTDPIAGWDDLIDWRRLQSTIGPPPMNWFRLQEVDLVIRPWVGAARVPRCRRTARRSVRPDRMGRSRSQLSDPAGRVEGGHSRIRACRCLPASRQHVRWACSPTHTNNACCGTAVSFTNDGMRRFAANRIDPGGHGGGGRPPRAGGGRPVARHGRWRRRLADPEGAHDARSDSARPSADASAARVPPCASSGRFTQAGCARRTAVAVCPGM